LKSSSLLPRARNLPKAATILHQAAAHLLVKDNSHHMQQRSKATTGILALSGNLTLVFLLVSLALLLVSRGVLTHMQHRTDVTSVYNGHSDHQRSGHCPPVS
jgi:hypothetical protein